MIVLATTRVRARAADPLPARRGRGPDRGLRRARPGDAGGHAFPAKSLGGRDRAAVHPPRRDVRLANSERADHGDRRVADARGTRCSRCSGSPTWPPGSTSRATWAASAGRSSGSSGSPARTAFPSRTASRSWSASRRPATGSSRGWAGRASSRSCSGLIQLTAIGLTLFRAVWIAAALVIITTFGLRRGRFGRLLFVAAVMGVLVLAAGSQLTQTSLVSERLDNTDNIYGRLATYEQGLDIFRDAPLFGVGVDQYHDYAEELRPGDGQRRRVRHVPAQHLHRDARRAGATGIRRRCSSSASPSGASSTPSRGRPPTLVRRRSREQGPARRSASSSCP